MQTEFDAQAEELIEENPKPKKHVFLVVFIVLTLLLGFFVYYSTQAYFLVDIDGASMQPTLYDGDTVFCKRKAQPKVGDVVVISGESSKGLIIKRVIATAGQTVMIKDGAVFVDGVRLEELYAKGQTVDIDGIWSSPRVLEQDQIFYLGDNRLVSMDSRSQTYGPCTIEQIVGVVPEWSITVKPLTSFIF